MYQKTVLDNGIRVVTNEMKGRESLALGIWVAVGGRYEDDKNKGAAHFLEHIVFKGTKSYACQEIKEKIEGVGGALNAFTSEEYTCYFAKIPAQHLESTFDILSDMVLVPLIAKKDVDKERTVILEEIKMYRDLPQYLVGELLDELVWPNIPLGKRLAGTPESVGAMSSVDLKIFHSQYYSASNIVVTASGKINHPSFVALVKERFAQSERNRSSSFIKFQDTQQKPKVKFFRKEIEQMHLALGSIGLDSSHPDRYALTIFNIILGANMSSRLFSEVREKRGLAYAISSGVKYLKDTGLFTVRAGVDNNKITEALKVILNELDKIKKSGVTKSEFTRAKDYYLGQILLELEDTLEHMFWIGEATVSLDRIRTLQDVLKEVKKLDLADVKRVAALVLKWEKLNVSLVGPLKDQQEKQIRTLLAIGS